MPPPPTLAATLAATLATSRQEAISLAQKAGHQDLLRFLKKAEKELTQRLFQATSLRGPGKESFTAVQAETTLKQVRDVIRTLQADMKGVITSQGKRAADMATGNLLDYLQRANKTFKGMGESPLAIKEAGLLMQATRGVEASILRRLASSGTDTPPSPARPGILQRYGLSVVEHFEEELAVGLVTRKPWDEVRDSLVTKSPFLQGAPAHWAERIVRTETMGAYNRASFEATREVDEQLGDMCKILAATFDDRTGWDSYQVHGQIRLPQQAFQWTNGFYQHPPNRPNDREVVIPHRISWPIPPYLAWRSDSEVSARYFKQRKSGSPGPRPMMTTIPLERFGKEQSKKKEDKPREEKKEESP